MSAARAALLLRALHSDQEFLTALGKVQLITDVDHRATVLKVTSRSRLQGVCMFVYK